MRKTILAAACAVVFAASWVARADTINLTGTVRDFKYNGTAGGHIDFENAIGTDPGIVTSVLGVDNKPVYGNHPGGTATTHGAAAFNQWYNDVAGVNLSTPVTLTLNNIGGGTYEYSSNAFFPIDGQLFGNQGSGHNYAFTFELHTLFAYQPGQFFSFAGDDDVWVYINHQRVIDLGGVHGAQSAGVNLDTLGLSAGTNYPLDFFFAERHTTGSNLRIDTSIASLVTADVPLPAAGSAGLVLLGVVLAGFRRARA